MDDFRKRQWIQFVEFLGTIVSPNTEIVLHFIDGDTSVVGAIVNGQVTGRDFNAPLTGLALQFIKEKTYLKQNSVLNYTGVAKGNADIQSSTFFITSPDGQELEAMICFNVDASAYLGLCRQILDLGHITQTVTQTITPNTAQGSNPAAGNERDGGKFVEYFSGSLKEIIHAIIPNEILESSTPLTQEQKLDAVRALRDKGFFTVKGAVAQTAEILRTSEPSIYRYLKKIEKFG